MVKYLAAHGNSAALIIDKPILELLGIDMKTPLNISTDGDCLVISPVRSPEREKKFRAALSRVMDRHRDTLRKLNKQTDRP